jgi:hypothetical protein
MRHLVIAVFAAWTAGPGGAFAQAPSPTETPEALSRVYACAALLNAEERLACYDAAVGALRTAEDTGRFVSVDREQVQELERDAFGFSLPSLPRLFGGRDGDGEEEASDAAASLSVDEVEMVVGRISTRGDGRAVFTMENGQRWVLVQSERVRNLRPGDSVTVRRASLGSFFLAPTEGGGGYRVRREE